MKFLPRKVHQALYSLAANIGIQIYFVLISLIMWVIWQSWMLLVGELYVDYVYLGKYRPLICPLLNDELLSGFCESKRVKNNPNNNIAHTMLFLLEHW